jgi:DeoR/GlpR family transcriptional regulator of sugar metabolism
MWRRESDNMTASDPHETRDDTAADVKRNKKLRGRSVERTPAVLRHTRIVAAFEKQGFVSIAEMAKELSVSTMTVRRDLDLLGKRGLLERTHGGAAPISQPAGLAFDMDEPAFERRMRINPGQKSAIARAAAGLVGQGESVGLDVGTSVLLLAQLLARRRDLRVFTNSLRVGMHMAEGSNTVYVLGGQVRVPEYSMIGAQAIEALKSHFLDKVFIGVSGIDADGLYDYSPEDSEVKRAFIECAGQSIMLCDSSKFSRRALSRIAPLSKIGVLVTESPPPDELAQALREAGTQVVIAA